MDECNNSSLNNGTYTMKAIHEYYVSTSKPILGTSISNGPSWSHYKISGFRLQIYSLSVNYPYGKIYQYNFKHLVIFKTCDPTCPFKNIVKQSTCKNKHVHKIND